MEEFKLKKFLLMSFVALLVFTGVASSTQAASGWQHIGNEYIKPNKLGTWNTSDWDYETYEWNETSHIAADGGNIGLTIPAHSSQVTWKSGTTPMIEVMAYENDGSQNSTQKIGTRYYYPLSDGTKTLVWDVSGWADGSNGKAEVEFRYTWNYMTNNSLLLNVLD
jgi:hypothetical protein